MSSTEVDELVTYPIQSALAGMPHIETVRSISKLGLSMITVIFDDSFNQYLARQLVAERLQEVRPRLPRNLQPVLGPMATAFGEVYQYTLSGPISAMQLKDLQEWQIKRQLRTVPGVSEVNTWGGEVKQYTQLLTDSRNQAIERLKLAAMEKGGNAVVAMRFDCNEIADLMSEIAAYGTAVIVRKR